MSRRIWKAKIGNKVAYSYFKNEAKEFLVDDINKEILDNPDYDIDIIISNIKVCQIGISERNF